MEIVKDLASLGSLHGPVYLAIGIFDGVHSDSLNSSSTQWSVIIIVVVWPAAAAVDL